MWVKICGNTNLDDCLLAAKLGADAVGFVFAPGKRTVTAAQVAPIVEQLPRHIEKIGVFTSGDFDAIRATVQQAGLTGVQVHGDVDFRLLERLRGHFGESETRYSIIQVLPWWVDLPAQEQLCSLLEQTSELARDGSADALLVDSRTRDQSGGTGLPFDWNAAQEVFASVRYPMIAAGGLTPDNVEAAIQRLLPWGVDVSSGIELFPGRKDPARLEQFLKRAKGSQN